MSAVRYEDGKDMCEPGERSGLVCPGKVIVGGLNSAQRELRAM